MLLVFKFLYCTAQQQKVWWDSATRVLQRGRTRPHFLLWSEQVLLHHTFIVGYQLKRTKQSNPTDVSNNQINALKQFLGRRMPANKVRAKCSRFSECIERKAIRAREGDGGQHRNIQRTTSTHSTWWTRRVALERVCTGRQGRRISPGVFANWHSLGAANLSQHVILDFLHIPTQCPLTRAHLYRAVNNRKEECAALRQERSTVLIKSNNQRTIKWKHQKRHEGPRRAHRSEHWQTRRTSRERFWNLAPLLRNAMQILRRRCPLLAAFTLISLLRGEFTIRLKVTHLSCATWLQPPHFSKGVVPLVFFLRCALFLFFILNNF